MNKYGLVVGITAMTALAGCMDPNYKSKRPHATLLHDPAPVEEPAPTPVTPVEPVTEPEADVHTVDVEVTTVDEPALKPVNVKPAEPVGVATAPVVAAPVATAPEMTPYIVQSGDTLSKISKRYNIKIDAIKKANPQLKGDTVRLGRTLMLPGKVEVGEQTVPAAAFAPKPAAKPYAPYVGETKIYVVQKGDVLGTIARKHGCTVRQLKELNGMTSDVVVLGRKMKVPAKAADTAAVAKAEPVKKAAEPKTVVEAPKPVEAVAEAAPAAPVEPEPAVEAAAPASAPVEAAPAPSAGDFDIYEVKDGEDMTNISITFNVSPSEIRQLNNLGDDAVLTPGMKLKLPAGTVQ